MWGLIKKILIWFLESGNDEVFEKIISSAPKKVDFLLASPPCQGMSIAGHNSPYDERNSLIKYAIDAVIELNPRFVFFENVTQQLVTPIICNGEEMLIPEYIHRRLVEERDKGRAVLLVSSELDEIMNLSDRIAVMYDGKINELAKALGVRMIHVNDIDTQQVSEPYNPDKLFTTWCMDSFWFEMLSEATANIGTHEQIDFEQECNFVNREKGFLEFKKLAADKKCRTYYPNGVFEGHMVPHEETITIAKGLEVKEEGNTQNEGGMSATNQKTDEKTNAEEEEYPQPKGARFNDQKPWKRIIVLVSGALMNYLLALVLLLEIKRLMNCTL